MKEQCENCWYYQREYKTDEKDHGNAVEYSGEYTGQGECRRFPPQVVAPDPDRLLVGGPTVLGTDWCGEWANAQQMAGHRIK